MTATRLAAQGLSVGYDDTPIIEDLDLRILEGELTVIVGPNACGKSTLLKTLARVLRPGRGSVLLDGQSIHSLPRREVAKTLGFLPQTATSPEGITVGDLVARGRYPHQSVFSQWSKQDQAAVEQALADTGTTQLRHRYVDELSGGQRQRVWIAMALAQQTPLILLDEPTTFLDMAYQIELLDLIRELQRQGRTVVAVLHELNLAARYATRIVMMKAGRIEAQGTPAEVLNAERLLSTFGLNARVIPDPDDGTPVILPR
ncbi:ABC transporter [Psychromicrobium lacuslunae]|uniref:ABC transporter n=1 Tax=Psychromicrobium lacuslunae TaxID=1618207 RepID=A0A0D4C3L8_9MICC|nr:ABC transporter [Psychromicrobium lacuslunae]